MLWNVFCRRPTYLTKIFPFYNIIQWVLIGFLPCLLVVFCQCFLFTPIPPRPLEERGNRGQDESGLADRANYLPRLVHPALNCAQNPINSWWRRRKLVKFYIWQSWERKKMRERRNCRLKDWREWEREIEDRHPTYGAKYEWKERIGNDHSKVVVRLNG